MTKQPAAAGTPPHAYDRVAPRTHRLAKRLLREGYEPHVVTDALIIEGLALWAAQTGQHTAAAWLTWLWTKIRDAANAE